MVLADGPSISNLLSMTVITHRLFVVAMSGALTSACACRRVSQFAGPDADRLCALRARDAGGQFRRQEGVTGGCDCARRDNHRGVTGESLTGRVALSGHAHPGRHPRKP